jgi:hypothetical protein
MIKIITIHKQQQLQQLHNDVEYPAYVALVLLAARSALHCAISVSVDTVFPIFICYIINKYFYYKNTQN